MDPQGNIVNTPLKVGLLTSFWEHPLGTQIFGHQDDLFMPSSADRVKDHPRTCKWLITMVIVSPLNGVIPLINGRTSWLINGG